MVTVTIVGRGIQKNQQNQMRVPARTSSEKMENPAKVWSYIGLMKINGTGFVTTGYENDLLTIFLKENLDFARRARNEGGQRGGLEDKDVADNSDTWSVEVNLDVGESIG